MPEGHLLHRLARDQTELIGRETRATPPQGRFAEGAAALDGRIVSAPLPAAARATVPEAEGRMVYEQPTCRACDTPVESWELAGRTAYACPRCQPR